MSEKTIAFTTYGPNRGKDVIFGNYYFHYGTCHIKEIDAAKAASILHNYHDVCYEHELEDKAAEYDRAQGVLMPDPIPVPPDSSESEVSETEPPADGDTEVATTTRKKSQDKS